ncbi:MAG: condensation domain-containing protein, partial [Gordonia amarae]
MTPAPDPLPPVSPLLTDTQIALWFGQQQVPGSPVYQCAERVDIRGDLDAGTFGDVLNRCLAAVPALNADYSTVPGGPRRQPVTRDHPVRLLDVSPATDPAKQCDHEIAEFMAAGDAASDLITGDRLSAQLLIRLSDGHHVWVQRIHHLCVDGYSFAALLRWVAASYTAAIAGDPLPDAPFVAPAVLDSADPAAV